MKAKKMLALALLASLTLAMFSACAGNGAPAATTAASSATTAAVTTTQAPKTEAPKTDFPKKTIEIVVPFNAGASVDNSIRVMAACAEPYLNGQKIIVSNKPGGSALVGQTYVAHAAPDGYTLCALTNSFISNITTQQTDMTENSFIGVMQYCFDPSACTAFINAPFDDPAEMVAYGKEHVISHATSGFGTAHHIAALLLEKAAGFKFKHIHMSGGSEQTANVAGGHILTSFGSYGTNVPMIEQGKMKVTGISATERDPRCPDIPTWKEYGYDVSYGAWRGIAAPAGTPKEVIDILCDAFTKALKEGGADEKLTAIDIPIYYRNSDDFAKHILAEYQTYKDEIIPLLEEAKKTEGGS